MLPWPLKGSDSARRSSAVWYSSAVDEDVSVPLYNMLAVLSYHSYRQMFQVSQMSHDSVVDKTDKDGFMVAEQTNGLASLQML